MKALLQLCGRRFALLPSHPLSPPKITFCLLLLVQTGAAQHRLDSWTTDNGLPQVSVNSILQTRDGFLWFTTFGGLVRYDGLRFQVFNAGNTKGLRTGRLISLFEDGEGGLWITTEGQGVTRYQDGVFTTYGTADGLPDNNVSRVEGDAQGNPLLLVGADLRRWTGAVFAPYAPAAGEPTKGVLQKTASGAIWYAEGERLRKFEGGRVMVDLTLGLSVLRLFEDTQGRAWIAADKTDELLVLRDGRLSSVRVDDGQPQHRFGPVYEDRQGRVWFGTASGLLLFKNGKLTRYTSADGLARGAVTTLYQDREGTIWVGTTGGLSRLTEKVVNTYSVADGLAAENVYPLYEDRQGRIWIGSWGGLTVYEDGEFHNVGARYGVAGDLISSLLEDADGNLWIGCWSGKVVRVREGKATVIAPAGSLGGRAHALYQDRAGDIWLGTANGLARFKDETFTPSASGTEAAGREVFCIHEDRQGRLWLGTDAGLVRYKDGVLTPFAGDAAPAGIVRALHEDGDGALWIGTYDGGLYRLRQGRFTRYTTDEGLFDNGAFQILEDGAGNFWISCNLGIYRVRKSELDDFADGRTPKITSVPYNKRDGMLNSECNGGTQPAGIRARDGRLWFPTQQGVAVINPNEVPINSQPPAVVITSLVVDTKPVDLRSPVELQPGQVNLEVHYSGLSYINPELVKFKYKLEGLDEDWVDAGTRRTAYYSHLPPGTYSFRVAAANRDGVWNEDGASVSFVVVPPFWRTWWFVSLAACFLAAAAFLLYRTRVARLERARRMQEVFSTQLIESQERERKRIAAELHDSLGQSLLVIKNRAYLGLNRADDPAAAHEQLKEISLSASDALQDVREIAYYLRPSQLDRLGLTTTLEEMLGRVATSSDINFSYRVAPLEGAFSPEAEINFFRVVQESVNNIIKHSAATEARIIIERDAHAVRLVVGDNGRGFAPDGVPGDGARKHSFGLTGLAERVRILGGSHTIHSAPGAGTTITVNIDTRGQAGG